MAKKAKKRTTVKADAKVTEALLKVSQIDPVHLKEAVRDVMLPVIEAFPEESRSQHFGCEAMRTLAAMATPKSVEVTNCNFYGQLKDEK